MTSSSGDHHLSPRSTPHSRPRDAGGTARRHVASFLAAIRVLNTTMHLTARERATAVLAVLLLDSETSA